MWPAQEERLHRYFVFKRAAYGLEGLASLQNTILDNDIQHTDRIVRQNTGWHGLRWFLTSSL